MILRRIAALALTFAAFALPAQEAGLWRASSTNAKSITGDIGFGENKLIINFLQFPISQIRPLTTDELLSVFNPDNPAAAVGHLYKLQIHGDQKFLHKNSLCGSDTVEWMATAIIGRELRIAMFSGGPVPALTVDSMNNGSNLCGTYTYTR